MTGSDWQRTSYDFDRIRLPQSLWTSRVGQYQSYRTIHRLSKVEVHLLLRLMYPLTCEGNVIQQVRHQPAWNVWSDLELPASDSEVPATLTCLRYDYLTTAVGLTAHDVPAVHWWFVTNFIFPGIIRGCSCSTETTSATFSPSRT
jgi:hypothetical protein